MTQTIRITSPDGTSIACQRGGSGFPLIIVHGSGAANPVAWTEVISTLEKRFTVYAVDRRGHRESGDTPGYAIEREFEDIAAIVNALDQPASLLGHSFGALVALESALLTSKLIKLILYEPAMPLNGRSVYPVGFIDRLQAQLESGDRAAVLTDVYREIANVSPEEIEAFKASPAWPARLAVAHNIVREALAEESYQFDPGRFKDMRIPTLLLLGGDSPPVFQEITRTVAGALPESRIAVMPGQQHTAMYTAPQLFLKEVLAFLTNQV